MRLNVAARLRTVTEGQHGYFTRAQAHAEGVAGFELDRAVAYDQIVRLDHGVYRLVGAGVDLHSELRVAWLRLTPARGARGRTHSPTLWVSHRSAARILGLGDFLADHHEFISIRRLQPRFEVRVHVRSGGLSRHDWVVRDGFAVTSPSRTLADLVRQEGDLGHLGRFASDALATGVATRDQLQEAIGRHLELDAILEMAVK